MKIKYRRVQNPEVEHVFDTVVEYNITPYYFKRHRTQEEFDEDELLRFELSKEKGVILSYYIFEA